jgi:DNA (cytosine-5)-methyltransferase 1
MRYLSVCSGIEAATVAWHPLGWEPVAFSETEAFPSAVLRHHYPQVPNRGDLTRFQEWDDTAFDVLVGGTPCQSFSVAGLRAGLADPRGNLALTYIAVLDRYRPRWCCWENVPGVLSADDGGALGAFLGGLGQLGYGFAYRVLDAQYFGLAQRRRRVFVVGCLGDWRRAAAVLFERASLSGHPPPRREAGESVTGSLAARASAGGGLGTDFDCAGGTVPVLAFGGNRTGGPLDVAAALGAHSGPHGRMDFASDTFIAHSLRADGFDASEDGTGRGTPIVPVTFDDQRGRDNGGFGFDQARTLHSAKGASEEQIVAFAENQRGEVVTSDTMGALKVGGGKPGQGYPVVAFANTAGDTVRRLTPRECERLQGFPDDYTLIPYRGKPAADGPRYKALGNSMAVPVMRWIGKRIARVSALDGEATIRRTGTD